MGISYSFVPIILDILAALFDLAYTYCFSCILSSNSDLPKMWNKSFTNQGYEKQRKEIMISHYNYIYRYFGINYMSISELFMIEG
jgi:hypothetical protein